MKQNPFSFYDFLGYLFPGAFALILMSIGYRINDANGLAEFIDNPSQSITDITNKLNLESSLIIVVIAYVAGHLIAFVSSLTIETYANWLYDYPSRYLLLENYKFNVKDLSVIKSILFWILYLLLFPVSFLAYELQLMIEFINHGMSPTTVKRCKFKRFKDSIRFILVKKLRENLDKRTNIYFPKRIDAYSQNLFFFKREKLSRLLFNKQRKNFKMKKGDYYRVITGYVYENHEKHSIKMDNYVALYGFLRSICFILIIFSWFVFISALKSINFNADFNFQWVIICFVSIISAFIFYLSFVKFYRRFTVEGIYAIISDTKIK